MYKIVVAMLLGAVMYSEISLAEKVSVNDFRIKLKNNTAYDCVLQKQQIIYGTVKDNVPEVIFRGETSSFIMKEYGYYKETTDLFDGYLTDALILLTYQCGDNQSISLLSHKAPLAKYIRERLIRGIILASNNLTASFATKYPSVYYGRPSEIVWVLNDDSSQPST